MRPPRAAAAAAALLVLFAGFSQVTAQALSLEVTSTPTTGAEASIPSVGDVNTEFVGIEATSAPTAPLVQLNTFLEAAPTIPEATTFTPPFASSDETMEAPAAAESLQTVAPPIESLVSPVAEDSGTSIDPIPVTTTTDGTASANRVMNLLRSTPATTTADDASSPLLATGGSSTTSTSTTTSTTTSGKSSLRSNSTKSSSASSATDDASGEGSDYLDASLMHACVCSGVRKVSLMSASDYCLSPAAVIGNKCGNAAVGEKGECPREGAQPCQDTGHVLTNNSICAFDKRDETYKCVASKEDLYIQKYGKKKKKALNSSTVPVGGGSGASRAGQETVRMVLLVAALVVGLTAVA